MRVIASIFVSIAILVGSGCGVIEKEATNRGGYLDYLLDEHWIKADSKGMRALRAFAIQVSLSRIASVSAKNESDRQLLAIRIGALTKRFMPIYACAFDTNPLGVPGAKNDPCFYYDSAMVDYSNGLFDLAMMALPVDDARRLISVVAGSVVNPLNLADLLDALLAIGKDALKYGRIVGALYRDTIELEVQVWLATPAIDDRPLRVTEAHVALLRAIYAQRNDDMPGWLAAIAELRSQGLEPIPHPKFFGELGGLMSHICTLITREPDALERCQAGLPTTVPPARSVLSTRTPVFVGRGLRESIPSEGPRRPLPGIVKNNPPLPDRETKMAGLTNAEKDLPRSVGEAIQRNLCITSPTTDFASARDAIQQAKIGANQSRVRLFTNIENRIANAAEAQLFLNATTPPCPLEDGHQTAYEKFRFPDEPAVTSLQEILRVCDQRLKVSGKLDSATRDAIEVAKGKINQTRRAGLTDLTTRTLRANSFAAIQATCR